MKFGVISCDDAEKWGKEDGLAQIFVEAYSKHMPNHDWYHIHAVSGKLPSNEEVPSFDGFLITGSKSSVNDQDKWILDLEKFVRFVFDMQQKNEKRKPKILGTCFGHQMVNKALGGTVAKNTQDRFALKNEHINLTSTFTDKFNFTQNEIVLFVSHGEEVTKLAKGAICCGGSLSCKNEVVLIGDSILTVQSHPEYALHHMKEIILPSVLERGIVSDDDKLEIIKSLDMRNDSEGILKLISQFLES